MFSVEVFVHQTDNEVISTAHNRGFIADISVFIVACRKHSLITKVHSIRHNTLDTKAQEGTRPQLY
jgi:hypothetical protein